MTNATQPTPAQQELLNFLQPLELPAIHRHLKEVFHVAAFESQIWKNDGGQNSMFTLYYLIELIEGLKNSPDK